VATAALLLWSAWLIGRVRAESVVERGEPATGGGWGRELFAGFRTLKDERDVRLLVGLFAAQTLVDGALGVLVVVSALALLDLGEAGVGFLNSAVGVGGLLGALLAFALVGRRRLASSFGLGLLLWGLPIALVGVWPHPVAALVLLAIVGAANTVVDTAGVTLLQRQVPDNVMGRVFGVLNAAAVASVAVGALVAPVLVEVLGIRGALVATGAFLPVLSAVAWRRLSAVDARVVPHEHELSLLGGVPFFATLPAATIEYLASRLTPSPLAKGSKLFREGDAGDRFYLIDKGELDVEVDGRLVATLARGDYVGEIALLRSAPRMATVTARTDVELLALERDDFVPTVTRHAASAQAADAVIATRLGHSP